MGDCGSGIACPGFSVLRFRREFLSRMRKPKGNRGRQSRCRRPPKNSLPCVRLNITFQHTKTLLSFAIFPRISYNKF